MSLLPEFNSWREHARRSLLKGMKPSDFTWSQEKLSTGDQAGFELFSETNLEKQASGLATAQKKNEFRVSREFLSLAETVSCARDEDRWQLLYRLLYRLCFENPNLLKVTVDDDVLRAQRLAKNIGRDIHKMHAFVRFKEVRDDAGVRFVAWHEPEHRILRLGAPFFMRRFGDRPWSIFTPEISAHWDCRELVYGDGLAKSDFPHEDDMDEIWKTYYRSIFNPARIKIKMMQSEMPMKYWQSLPEASVIQDLIREAPERLEELARRQPKAAKVPAFETLGDLAKHASGCDACPLHAHATQTVFGEGPSKAHIAIIGEQPGDNEDLEGRPFVGPAGQVLNDALAAAGLLREDLYLTNAVKHFKYQQRGKLRLHQKPTGSEMHACRPWLEAEIAKVNPKVVILLGTTAGTSWLGRLPRLTEERGQLLDSRGRGFESPQKAILSWHPSAILRANSEAERQEKFNDLVRDLRLAHEQSLRD